MIRRSIPTCAGVHFLNVHWTISGELPDCEPPQLRGLARSERPFASAPPDGGEADSCRERPSQRLSERDSGSASVLVGGLGTDRSQRREEWTNETMLKCPNGRGLSPRVRRYLRYSVRKSHQSAGKRTACLEKCNRCWACRPTHAGAAPHEPTEGRYRGWVSTVRRRSFTCWSTSSTSIGTSSAMGTTSRMRRALRLYVK